MSAPKWKSLLPLITAALLLAATIHFTHPARAAGGCAPVVTVTNAADSGAGTLRQALVDVCADGLIDFGFATPTTIFLHTNHLAVSKNVTIDGSTAPDVTVSGGSIVRVFKIEAGRVVTINDLTIRDGYAPIAAGVFNAGTLTLQNVTITFNNAGGGTANRGGGLYNLYGTATLLDSAITYNTAAQYNNPPDIQGGQGGGIYNDNGTLIISNSTIAHNLAEQGSGGGVYNTSGTVTITDATFDANVAGFEGGGLFNGGGATVRDTVFSNNEGWKKGGGILQSAGALHIHSSTFSGNTGNPSAGGDQGAGLYVRVGQVTMNNSTVTNGQSVDRAGGVYLESGSFTYENSIIAGNSGGNNINCYGPVTTGGHNLVVTNTGCPVDEETDIGVGNGVVFTTVLSETLADNGGPTRTHALLPYSPAINAGNPATCEPTDQRGLPRPQSFVCDMGALEAESAIDLTLGFAPLPPYVPADAPLTYALAITNAGPLPATNVLVTDTLPTQVTFISADAGLGACQNAGNVVTCTLPFIPASTVAHIDIVVMPPDGPATIGNQAIAFAENPEAYLPDNEAGVDTTVCYCTDLEITQTVYPPAPYHGDIVTFTVTVVNTTTDEIATRVFITDTFPSNATLITYTSSIGDCQFLGSSFACSWGEMPAGASEQLQVVVLHNPGVGSIENTATIASREIDYNPEDNTHSLEVFFTKVSDLQLFKKDNPGLGLLNEPLTYTLLLKNAGPDVGRPVRMINVLPPSFIYVPPFTDEARLRLHLDEPRGATTFKDYSAYDSLFTCAGSSCPTAGGAGRFGAALSFDGNDYVQGPTGTGVNPGAELTVAAWIYSTSTSSDREYVNKGFQGNGYVLGQLSNKIFAGIWDATGTHFSLNSGALPNNQWVHVAFTWKTGGEFVVYVNGNETGSRDAGIYPIGSNSNPIYIGKASWGNYFNGRIDEIHLFRRALSAGEIGLLHGGNYAAECDEANQAITCDLAALNPNQVVPVNITAIPTQLGVFNSRADADQITYDPDYSNNTTYLRTRVVQTDSITLTVRLQYRMQDGEGDINELWLLKDDTFMDDEAATGTWSFIDEPLRLTLQYDPGYNCDAFMVGQIGGTPPYAQGARECQDGSGRTGLWRGYFFAPPAARNRNPVFSKKPGFYDGCSPAIVITSAADSGPDTLRQALLDVCASGLITFDFDQPTTIVLTSGQLVVGQSVTIDGATSPGVTVSGNHQQRVFKIQAGRAVTMRNLTIRDGYAAIGGGVVNAGILTLNHVILAGNAAAGSGNNRGGAIFNDAGGNLTLHESTVSNNTALELYIYPNHYEGRGGGIYNNGGVVILNQSVLAHNAAQLGFGGGAYNLSGLLQLNDTLVQDNLAESEGGGIYSDGAAVIARSTIAGNQALKNGGGILLSSGSLWLHDSTLSGNMGDDNAGGDQGAGLYMRTGSATINNSTITRNVEVSTGGGYYVVAGLLSFGNSIIAGNDAASANDCYGNALSSGHNLTLIGSGCPVNDTDITVSAGIIYSELLSETLADNGGPTPTHALLPYSPAINAADPAACDATDQRGVPRPQSFACDIGAFETETAVELTLGFAALPTYIPADEPLTYTAVISNGGPMDAHNAVFTDTLPANVTFLSANAELGSCSHAANVVTCTLPLIPADTTTTVNIMVMPPDRPAQISNSAVILADDQEAYLPDNSDGVDNTVCYCTDLVISQTSFPHPAYYGSIITFTVTVVNSDTEVTTGVYVTDTFPANTTVLTYTTSQGTCAFLGHDVACQWGSLAGGQSAQMQVVVAPNPGAIDLTNSAVVASFAFDFHPEDNSTDLQTILRPLADLRVTNVANPGVAVRGQPFTATLVIDNAGPQRAEPITMTLPLPPGMVYVPPLSDEARLHYHLDEPAGSTTFADSSSYGTDLTCSGATCPSADVGGQFGAAVKFDGSNDYLQAPSGDALNPGEALTFALWIYAPSPGSDRKFGGKAVSNTGYALGHIQNKLYPEVWDAVGTRYTFQSGFIPANNWTHVAMTWQTNGYLIGYINGIEVNRIPTGAYPIASNDNPFILGRAPWASQFLFNGRLDEAYVFNRVLSQKEILSLAAGGYVADCGVAGQTLTCTMPALDADQSVIVNTVAVPLQLGLFAYDAVVSQEIDDPDLANNVAALRTFVLRQSDIRAIVDVTYIMQDLSGGVNRVWMLQDGTFIDNEISTGVWALLTEPPRLQLDYDDPYQCGALMTGEISGLPPKARGLRICQDGSGLVGLWRGDFVASPETGFFGKTRFLLRNDLPGSFVTDDGPG